MSLPLDAAATAATKVIKLLSVPLHDYFFLPILCVRTCSWSSSGRTSPEPRRRRAPENRNSDPLNPGGRCR